MLFKVNKLFCCSKCRNNYLYANDLEYRRKKLLNEKKRRKLLKNTDVNKSKHAAMLVLHKKLTGGLSWKLKM